MSLRGTKDVKQFYTEVNLHGSKNQIKENGQKKAPFYRIIVADSRSPRDGRFIEEIGTYDPTVEPSAIKVDAELAQKWLTNGAQPTDTVAKISNMQVLQNNHLWRCSQ